MKSKINLNIEERLTTPKFIPETGTFIEALIIDALRKKIIISPEEAEAMDLKFIPAGNGKSNIQYNKNKAMIKEIELEDSELEMIIKEIDKADKKGAIEPGDISVIKKIRACGQDAEESGNE